MPYPESRGQPGKTENLGKIIYGCDSSQFYPILGRLSGTSLIQRVDVENTETIETDLVSAQTIAASASVLSSTVSVVGVKRATVLIFHGRAATAGFGTNGTEYRVEVSAQSSGNETWQPIASILTGSAVCNSAAASSNCAAGTTLVTITSGTAMPARDIICFTSGTIEWVRSTVANGTASFNVLDATTYDHASATGIFSSAELFPLTFNLESVTRLRAVVNNLASGTTQPIASRIAFITEK